MKKIGVASGKGGTGKTTVSLLIAAVLSDKNRVQLLDCDVENPDCHLFFNENFKNREKVEVFYPAIDNKKCNLCGKCQEVCQYNCLLVTEKEVMFFSELCHPCKGCMVVCPKDAISEGKREVGEIFSYEINENFYFDYGIMNVGEARANPVIEILKEKERDDADFVILDSPPGANCPMVEALKNADYALLVTEPTPFGLYDLKLAWYVVRDLDIPCSVVINRSENDDRIIEDFTREQGLDIILKIPFSRKFASYYSKGIIKRGYFPDAEMKIKEFFFNL